MGYICTSTYISLLGFIDQTKGTHLNIYFIIKNLKTDHSVTLRSMVMKKLKIFKIRLQKD